MPTQSVRAWTGGSTPPDNLLSIPGVTELVLRLYAEQCSDFSAYWRENVPLDVAGTFWTRAKYDAWATVRN